MTIAIRSTPQGRIVGVGEAPVRSNRLRQGREIAMVADGQTAVDPPTDPGGSTRWQRAGRSEHADVWRRFQEAQRRGRWSSIDRRTEAVFTNLIELATLGEAEDHRELDRLVRLLGNERLATIQNRVDGMLGYAEDLHVLTLAIRRIAVPRDVAETLVADGMDVVEATELAARCQQHLFWMLLTDDAAGPHVRLETPADVVRVVEHGTAREWRAAVAPIARNPWGPECERLVNLATEAALPGLERGIRECCRVYRLRQEERERAVVAREIRRLVALSGLSQREFASYVGTSPSRLSTYATGKVTPSAAMMVRIQGVAQMLSERARDIVA
jgi:hypothetical protein